MGAERPLTNTERSARRRAALRERGLKPRTFWLPDFSNPEFKKRAEDACRRVNRFMADADDMAFVQAIQYWPPDD